MKKLIALLLALAMVLSLAACGAKEPAVDEPDDPIAEVPGEEVSDEDATEEDPAADLPSFTFTRFGKAKITILGAEMVEDSYGDTFMRVYYEYLNMDETAAGHTPCLALTMEITQGEEELYHNEFGEYDDERIPEDVFYNCAMQPGIPVRNTINIYCDPEGDPVDIGMYVMVGSWAYNEEDLEWFKFQMDPKDLKIGRAHV